MKYELGILAVLLLSMSMIMAGTCTPDSGFDWCYSDSYSYGDAIARSEVQGTYPTCEGEQSGGKCVGDWYSEIMGGKDDLYIYRSITSWSGFWDNVARCDENGCSGEKLSGGSKHTYKLSDSSGKVPGYVLVGYDYREASNGDWAWATTSGGYTVDYFGGLSTVDCINGREECDGTSLRKCENDNWANKGQVVGECGIFCSQDSDCGVEESLGDSCSGNNIITSIKKPKCQSPLSPCATTIETATKEVCSLGCNSTSTIPVCNEAAPEQEPTDIIKIETPVIIGGAIILILIAIGIIIFLGRKK